MQKKKGKVNDFFGLWCSVMNACGDAADEDPFWDLCQGIFDKEYTGGKEAKAWLHDELAKISAPKQREKLADAAENLMAQSKYFYLAVGYALAQDYEVSSPKARAQIQYLRRRIREASIFPLAARSTQPVGGTPVAANIFPARNEDLEKATPKKKEQASESGYLTAQEVAKKLGVSYSWFLRKAKCKVVPHVRIGGVIRFLEKEVDVWIRAHGVKGALKV